MTLAEKFEIASRTTQGIIPFCIEMGRALDDIDKRLAPLREKSLVVPIINTPEMPSFAKRFAGANGWGDVLTALRQAAAKLDEIQAFLDTLQAAETASAPSASEDAAPRRGPGRPRKVA